jgi:hypothetical protein
MADAEELLNPKVVEVEEGAKDEDEDEESKEKEDEGE